MKKTAQFASLWPQIYRKLKNPPAGVNLGTFPGKLPPINKIVIDPTRLEGEGQAIGYVSTEDADNNGVLDTIHIASPRLEEAMRSAGVPLHDFQNLDQLSSDQLVRVLTPFVELLSHEMGHLQDYKPGQENVFPGGESPAESAARSAVQSVSLATTNNSFGKRGSSMSPRLLKALTKLANRLDQKGATAVADHIDQMIEKYSQAQPGEVDYGAVFQKKFPEPQAEPGDLDFQAPLQRIKEKVKGNIRPVGDPYTYNFDVGSKTFTVATTPSGKEYVIGRKIGPGDPGYGKLRSEAIRMGLIDVAPPAQMETPTEFPPEQELLSSIGFKPGDVVAPETVIPFIIAKKQNFREAMNRLADKIIELSGSIGAGGPVRSMLMDSAELLKDPNLTGQQAVEIFNKKLQPLLLVGVGQQNTSDYREEFKSVLDLWNEVYKLEVLRRNLLAKGLVDQGQTLSSINQADDQVSEEKEEEEEEKTASKEIDYKQVFASNIKNPFGRSNARFSR